MPLTNLIDQINSEIAQAGAEIQAAQARQATAQSALQSVRQIPDDQAALIEKLVTPATEAAVPDTASAQ